MSDNTTIGALAVLVALLSAPAAAATPAACTTAIVSGAVVGGPANLLTINHANAPDAVIRHPLECIGPVACRGVAFIRDETVQVLDRDTHYTTVSADIWFPAGRQRVVVYARPADVIC